MKTRESSKANAVAMRGLAASTEEIKRLKADMAGEESMEEEIARLEETSRL